MKCNIFFSFKMDINDLCFNVDNGDNDTNNRVHALFPWKQGAFSTRYDGGYPWGCHLHSPMYL